MHTHTHPTQTPKCNKEISRPCSYHSTGLTTPQARHPITSHPYTHATQYHPPCLCERLRVVEFRNLKQVLELRFVPALGQGPIFSNLAIMVSVFVNLPAPRVGVVGAVARAINELR
jgi:hypothetical protein